MNAHAAHMASSAKFHPLLYAILVESCIQQSGHLSYDKSVFARLFQLIVMNYDSIYAPPWCFRMLQMCGMVGFLGSRLFCHPHLSNQAIHPKIRAQLLRKLFRRGFSLELYVNYIRDPSRMQIFQEVHIGGIFQRPYAVTFYHGCLFVTVGDKIYKTDTSKPRLSLILFKRIQGTTFYGLDVADDGTLAVIGYSNMKLFLFSQQANEILNVRIGSPQHHHFFSSGVCWTHNFQALICFTNEGLIAMKRTGEFICQLGTKGSQSGSFRGEGKIDRLPKFGHFLVPKFGHFLVTDSDNNRVQIIEINLEKQQLIVIRVFGYGEMFTPLGSAIFGNCILTSGHGDSCLYNTNCFGRTRQFFDGVLGCPRFVMSLPGGIFIVADTGNGRILCMSEDRFSPVSSETCLPGIPLDDTFFRIPIQIENVGAANMPQTVDVSAVSTVSTQRVAASTQCEPFEEQTVAVSAQVRPTIESAIHAAIYQHYCSMM